MLVPLANVVKSESTGVTGNNNTNNNSISNYNKSSVTIGSGGSSSSSKGKALPLQAWGGPEGSRKLRFPDFMTTAQDGGKVVSLTHRPSLPPGNTPGTLFC